MGVPVIFPLSTPQTPLAQRVMSQMEHSSTAVQHALAEQLERDREHQKKSVNQTAPAEEEIVDDREGRHAEARNGYSKPRRREKRKSSSTVPPNEDELQGRYVNVLA